MLDLAETLGFNAWHVGLTQNSSNWPGSLVFRNMSMESIQKCDALSD